MSVLSVNSERRSLGESAKKVEKKVEGLRVAEKLGKFSRMAAKNGVGDKGGMYGH